MNYTENNVANLAKNFPKVISRTSPGKPDASRLIDETVIYTES